MVIKIGPAGIGSVNDVEETFRGFKEKGIEIAEIPFTYGVYIKSKNVAEKVGEFSKKYGIRLSIHAPYWINLNSSEKEKVESSKKRILKSCEVGAWISSVIDHKVKVVFHAGYYGKNSPEETYYKIKGEIIEMMEIIKEKKWNVVLCPEIMGKKNVFGSLEEISRLSEETGCGFCIDFAHILARYGRYEIEKARKLFPQKKWHCHFSGIEYGDKGEKNHKETSREDWENVLKLLKDLDKDIEIVNEAPHPVNDVILGLDVLNGLR